MLKKLNLDQTKTYEICIATFNISEMLIAYIQGRKHFLRIGSEQGDIETWDDLIIEHENGLYEHIQVKRQHTDFSNDPCIRNYVHAGKPQQRLRDLSPIDKTLASLAQWSLTKNPCSSNPKRLFAIEVPDNTMSMKQNLKISHLSDFCKNEITPSTTASSLAYLQARHKNTENLFNWLTTWCGFTDWEHILKAFKALEIRQTGNEIDLERRTETLLNYCFNDSNAIRKQIHTYITDNSSYTSAISPRPLLGKLKSQCITGLVTWTQYVKDKAIWSISGTNDTGHDSIELAPKVVEGLWKPPRKSELKININSALDEALPSSLMRLIIHLPNLASAHLNNPSNWEARTRERIGGTLGVDVDDCYQQSIVDCSSTNTSSDSRTLSLIAESDKEAKALESTMDEHTWICICDCVNDNLLLMAATELRDNIEVRWSKWRVELNQDIEKCIELYDCP